MKEITTPRKYFEFRQSKGANVGHALEAVDTVEAMLMAQQMHLERQNKYREACGKLMAAILTKYYTSGHRLGVEAILNSSLDNILLMFLEINWPRDKILEAFNAKEVLQAYEEREKDIADRALELKVLIEEALDKI